MNEFRCKFCGCRFKLPEYIFTLYLINRLDHTPDTCEDCADSDIEHDNTTDNFTDADNGLL